MPAQNRSGDEGFTVLSGADGKSQLRLRKDDSRLMALGAVDELNAAIGMCVAEARRRKMAKITQGLIRVQEELFRVGAALAAIGAGASPDALVDEAAVTRMQDEIDSIGAEVGQLEHFVLPGGCDLAARLHVARTIARRAERGVVTVLGISKHARRNVAAAGVVVRYMNRLSGMLFALARKANHDAGQEERIWKP